MRRVYHRPRPDFEEKRFRVNQQIRVPEVFLIDENGQSIGVVPTSKALAMAIDAGLDVVEVNPKVKQKKVEIKGIRLSVRISQHDFDVRVEQAKKFLERGDKLKLELILKGRERQHPAKAEEIMKKFYRLLKETPGLNMGIEQGLTKQGGRFNIILINQS